MMNNSICLDKRVVNMSARSLSLLMSLPGHHRMFSGNSNLCTLLRLKICG